MHNSNLFAYDELNEQAKDFARQCVLYELYSGYKDKLNWVKEIRNKQGKKSLNLRINTCLFQKVVYSLQIWKKYQKLPVPNLERLIEENLCRFDITGRSYSFINKRFSDFNIALVLNE